MNPTTTDGLRTAEPAALLSLDELAARFAAAARALWPEAEPVVQLEPSSEYWFIWLSAV